MRRLALLLFAVSLPAAAVLGTLVRQSSTVVGGQFYTVCTYNVAGSLINQMIPGPAVCPPSINM